MDVAHEHETKYQYFLTCQVHVANEKDCKRRHFCQRQLSGRNSEVGNKENHALAGSQLDCECCTILMGALCWTCCYQCDKAIVGGFSFLQCLSSI